MANGTYKINLAPSGNANYYGTNYTICEYGKFDKAVKLQSVIIYAYQGGMMSAKPVVYSNTAKIAEGPVTSLYMNSGNFAYFEFGGAGVSLSANVDYFIGFYVPSSSSNYPLVNNTSTTYSIPSSPAYATFTRQAGSHYFTTGDARPTSPGNYVAPGLFGFDAGNVVPTAPTNVSVTNSPVPVGNPVDISWTHNDPDGNPQSKYQIRWRKKD